MRGAQLQNQTVSIKDKKTRDRITAAFKLAASDSKVSGAEIRRRFIRHHPIYGIVVLNPEGGSNTPIDRHRQRIGTA